MTSIITHIMDLVGTEISNGLTVFGKFSLGATYNFVLQATTSAYSSAILYGYAIEKPIYYYRYDGVTYVRNIVLTSDLGYVDCCVTTTSNNVVAIPNAPASRYGFIPVITGHDTTSSAHDNVFYDSGEWRIYSNYSQKVFIRFYIYPV